MGWHLITFRGITRQTRYAVVREETGWVLHAQSETAAAGLYRPLDLDARAYPTITWRWKIARILERPDPTKKAGDDYPARVYVAFAYQPERESVWERTKFEFYRAFYGEYPPGSVINYVWETRLPPETSYPNPYTARARMVVVRSGAERTGTWVAERRDFLADYRRLFGAEPPRLVGVAVMTDTDDTGERAEAAYDAVTLHP
ncbi:MAG TPA: DUF3047 domain-containing protein [Methylomirabilota bacterium]|nr:DUF3047 domain-containing protein [Methylomirabilota bacterium]